MVAIAYGMEVTFSKSYEKITGKYFADNFNTCFAQDDGKGFL